MDAQFDAAVVKMATAIANEWQAFSLQELAVYCQQAVMSGYNPVARPWECIPVRSDDGQRVSLWPTYSSVAADGAEWLTMQSVPWRYVEDGKWLSRVTDAEKAEHGMTNGDRLYRCTIEHGRRRRAWQQEIGRLVKDGWPYDAAKAHAGECPAWEAVVGYGVAGVRDGDAAKAGAIGALRARRNAWLKVVTPSEMHAARQHRNRTLLQDIRADMTTYEGERPHDRLNRGVGNLTSEEPWG